MHNQAVSRVDIQVRGQLPNQIIAKQSMEASTRKNSQALHMQHYDDLKVMVDARTRL